MTIKEGGVPELWHTPTGPVGVPHREIYFNSVLGIGSAE